MSTEKGNCSRSRPQKHKNRSVFKNNLHDTSQRTKMINGIQARNVCERCKEIIDWKIKYKKYKPLTQPRKCVRCDQKNIKQAYHVMCNDCSRKFQVCAKCCKAKDLVEALPDKNEQLKLDVDMQQMLQTLSERKRRTFIRYMNKKPEEDEQQKSKEDLILKLNALKVDENESGSDFSDGEESF